MQSDVVTQSWPHVRKPSDLRALHRASIACIVEEDAVISCAEGVRAPCPVVVSRGRRPSVAPPLPQQVPVLSAAKIEIASQDAKLIPVLPLLCAADVEQLALPGVSLLGSLARFGVRGQDGPAAPARSDEVAPVCGCRNPNRAS